MYDHVGLGSGDFAASRRFYLTLLGALGSEAGHDDAELVEWEDFDLSPADDTRPITSGLHVAFGAVSRDEVDRAWRAMADAGFETDGDPGARPHYGPSYYGAFLRDPDGNSAEIVHRDEVRLDGDIDHLWVRVADADASRAFYDAIAEPAGLSAAEAQPGDFAHYTAPDGRGALRFVTSEERTTPVHIAFPAPDQETVQRFHEAALAAGYRDNGGPGERPEYHPGYYGAFALDPDGHNIEVVFHDGS